MSLSKTKIVIAGIGGVGGYFGGLLARQYHLDSKIEVCFLAKGEHLNEINKNGLTILHGPNRLKAIPHIATHDANEIGISDLVIICTKSYDLDQVLIQLQPCINKNTILLPLLNGIDHLQQIKQSYPDNLIAEGCVYIVSRLKQAGIIENSGNIQKLFFGINGAMPPQFIILEKIFKAAGIEVILSESITSIIWEKFIFLSPTATITSAYDKCIEELLKQKEFLDDYISLINEIVTIAIHKGIVQPNKIIDITFNKIRALPFDTTSSMQMDFKNKKTRTEINSLTKFVIDQGKLMNTPTPTYIKLYELITKSNS